jgi:hypothetical protein
MIAEQSLKGIFAIDWASTIGALNFSRILRFFNVFVPARKYFIENQINYQNTPHG